MIESKPPTYFVRVCVAANRAAKGAEAGVHETGGAAKRSEEK